MSPLKISRAGPVILILSLAYILILFILIVTGYAKLGSVIQMRLGEEDECT